ncbi:MAG: 4-alpha-glucanotransferase [Oscillospiraceae bacterium]|nr:4-alpha-glucanotransferase [Oscillospiraceae bacterium]
MKNTRAAGVLMHITSLPSPYGVGVFGRDTKNFIDFLADMKFTYWQVLPFVPTDEMNSPYCSPSSFAGNELFIDPAGLRDRGLCTDADIADCVYGGSPYTAAYSFAAEKREKLLKKSYANANEKIKKSAAAFAEKHPHIAEYAYFAALKAKNGGKPWYEWEKNEADFAHFMKSGRECIKDDFEFICFKQYIFFEQWREIKKYAADKNVKIIGDMPIYVALDSADVWACPENFRLDLKTFKPQSVAGVPPDYFSEDGQLWGNPLYDWEHMEKDGCKWWLERLGSAFDMFDVVRIDHFRAFASYWAVPADSDTAKNGEWQKGPGMKFFNRLFEKYPDAPVIAEDLGVFGEDVTELLRETGFPGMKVIQFAFTPGADSLHLPHHCTPNSAVYCGTHDNNTLFGWLFEAPEAERNYILRYVGFRGDNWGEGGYHAPACRSIIETVWRTSSRIAVIAFQDMCGFGNDARMNIPGVPELNWRFRTTAETIANVDKKYFREINGLFGRAAMPGEAVRR